MKNFTRKVVRNSLDPPDRQRALSRPATDQSPGSAPGGTGPLRPLHEGPRYTVGLRAQDGVNLGSAVRAFPRRGVRAAASNLDTQLDRRFGRRVRMLLSFQRPSHLFRKELLLRGRARGHKTGSRGGPTSIALLSGVIALATKNEPGLSRRLRQDTTWTVIVRSRGRSSKSISTICCHVPRARRPSITGIVSDGPISAARRWACELES